MTTSAPEPRSTPHPCPDGPREGLARRTLRAAAAGLLLLGIGAGAGRAWELPVERYPAATELEVRFRTLRAREAEDPGAAARGYRSLLDAGLRPADAVHAALGRVLPPDEARAHWQAILAESPPSPYLPEALDALAQAAAGQGRWDEAAGLYARLVRAAPDEATRARALRGRMAALDAAGRRQEALQAAEKLWVDLAHRPEAREAEVLLARGTGDPFRPVTGERIFRRGTVLLEKGRREEAVRTLRKLLSRLVPGSRIEPGVNLALGKALYFLRRYEEALGPLSRAAQAGEGRVAEDARFYRARCLFGLDRGDEGARDLFALARERPRSRRAPLYLYQAYRVLEGRALWGEAAGARNLLLGRYPGSTEARDTRFNQGWRAFRQGRNAEAAAEFAASAEGARPGWVRARGLYWQARALRAEGKEAEARAALRTLLEEHPLGYYARLSRSLLEGAQEPRLDLADPRRAPAPPGLPAWPPSAKDLDPAGRDGRALAYLRLGELEPARRLLRAAGRGGARMARLLYWAEDFRGAARAASRSWTDWPRSGRPDPLSPEALAFPVAFPRSAARAAAEAGVHPHLVLAVGYTESRFDPGAYSPWEARGVMQFIPATGSAVARDLGLEAFEPEDLFDPVLALRLGARHLRDLLDRFDGNTVAAVAAYNGGASAVERWLRARGDEPIDVFVEMIPYRETRKYVKKVLTALDAYGRMDPPGLWPE